MAEEIVSLPYTPLKATPSDNLSTEELQQQIANIVEGKSVATPAPAADKVVEPVVPVTPAPAPAADKAPVAPISPEQPSVSKPAEQSQAKPVDQKADTLIAADKLPGLLAKKGMSNPEQLYKSYEELERAFHKNNQELAEARRVQAAPPIVDTEGNIVTYEQSLNQGFLNDFQIDPIGAIRQAVAILNNPLIEDVNKQKLHTTVVTLSSSPETAEFNLPEVQDEIKKILEEKPELRADLAGNLPDLTDRAIGRLYRTGKLKSEAVDLGKKIAEQNLLNKQSAGMESAVNKPPAPPAPFDPWKCSEQELLNRILELNQQISR